MNEKIEMLVKYLNLYRITIKATADESLIITDQETGEEMLLKDLGYPI